MNTWDILICSIWHRTGLLDALLTELERQQQPGVGIIVCRDNLQLSYGEKVNRLMAASGATYVSQIDDDDWIAPTFVARILDALRRDPDYVGFNVKWTQDGEPMCRVEHTLQHTGWCNQPDLLSRDIVHFNPMRRDLAVQAPWTGGNGADRLWADCIRSLGIVTREVYIDEEMYYYRLVLADTFTAPRTTMQDEPPLAVHPGVTFV